MCTHPMIQEMVATVTERERQAVRPARVRATDELVLRIAGGDDRAALEALSELDGRGPIAAPVLLAQVAGRPIAALSLTDGTVAADPFTPTVDAVALLQARATQIAREPAPRRRIRRPLAARA